MTHQVHVKTLAADLARAGRAATVYQWVHDPETWLRDAGAAQLASDPHAASLHSLDISRHGIGPEGARALADSPHLGNLRELRLDGNPLGDEGAVALAASPHLVHLKVLGLGNAGLRVEGLRALLESAIVSRLEELDLTGGLVPFVAGAHNFGPAGARLIAEGTLPRLKSLRLAEQWIGPEGAAALAASPLLRRLRALDLSRNGLGEDGLRALAASPHLQPGLRLGTGSNGVQGGEWREYTDWNGAVLSEGYEEVSARPRELAKKGIVFPPGVEIY